MRKGQMHVIDAVAAVMLLFFFAIGGFSTADDRDWSQFENQIVADDLSYTLKETGHLNEFVREGSTGSMKKAFNGITQRDFSTSGSITGTAPNLEIGFFKRPSSLESVPVVDVSNGDDCYSEVQSELEPRSAWDVVRTEASAIRNDNDQVNFYVGDYHVDGEDVSQNNYDSLWVERGNCNFVEVASPVESGDIFEWDTGNYYEFREANVNSSDWSGTVEIVPADQMKRIQETMREDVNGINNRVEVDSFTFDGDDDVQDITDITEGFGFILFPEKRSLEMIDDEGLGDAINQVIEDKPVLFAANLNQSLVENTVLQDNGFRWKDLGYRDQRGCGVTDQEISSSCGTLEVGFSSTQSSQVTREMMSGMKADLSGLSLYPSGSVVTEDKGALSFDKTMYLENFGYSEISQDRMNTGLTEDTSVDGRPVTSCGNITSGTLDFPDSNGGLQTLDIVNTQLGNTPSYCSQNNRAIYIDRDGDGSFSDSDEGPFQDGQRTEIRGLEYVARIRDSTASGCGPDDCAGFVLDENAQVNVFTFNSDNGIGRVPYEDVYSSEDRKAVAGFIYMIAGSTKVQGNAGGAISTNIYSSTGEEPFSISMRWEN